jgi:hypothetical protein
MLQVAPREALMIDSKWWLSAAALAATTLPAIASAPAVERPAPSLVDGATGLTAADLIVGRDGTVAVDLSARGIAVADDSDSGAHNRSCVHDSGC